MVGISIAATLAGGIAAGGAAYWYLPQLAPTREGAAAHWIVCLLLGLAGALLALRLYLAIHDVAESGADVSGVFDETLDLVITQCGVLLGVATAVYLLAPPTED